MNIPPHFPTNPSKKPFLHSIYWSILIHSLFLFFIFLKTISKNKPLPSRLTYSKVDLISFSEILENEPPLKSKTLPSKTHLNSLPQTQKSPTSPPKVQKGPLLSKKNQKALQALTSFLQKQSTHPSKVSTSLDEKHHKKAQFISYYEHLQKQIREYWSIPWLIANHHYSAQVQIYINTQGELVRIEWIKSSENPQFNEIIKKTLQEAAPFSPPPSQLQNALITEGILVGFPL